MALKQLAKVDKRTKFAMHGWMREIEEKFKLNVPSMVTAICTLYYREDEVFDIISENTKLSDNKKRITAINKSSAWEENNFGINVIPSDSDAIYEWKLKIVSDRREYAEDIQIGIASVPQKNQWITIGSYYLFCSGHKRKWDHYWKYYDASFTEGAEVILHLDLKKAEIKLTVDGNKGSVAYYGIDKSSEIKYRLVTSLYLEGNCVEIMSFTKK